MEQLQRLSPSDLREFVTANYTGPRLILAASGVEHGRLVELATPMLQQVREGQKEGRGRARAADKGGREGDGGVGRREIWRHLCCSR